MNVGYKSVRIRILKLSIISQQHEASFIEGRLFL